MLILATVRAIKNNILASLDVVTGTWEMVMIIEVSLMVSIYCVNLTSWEMVMIIDVSSKGSVYNIILTLGEGDDY